VKIPTPRFAVFYNGEEKQPEQYELKLSDAFEHPVEEPEIELKCKVYNINQGRNRELLEKCPVLKEYMIFVDYVREFHRQSDYEELEHAIERAIDRCIEENVLRKFLIEHRSEVVKVTKLDYTFDRQLTLEREDARAEGKAEGRAEGRAEGKAEGRAEGKAEGRAEGRAEGKAEGRAEGQAKERESAIRTMLKLLQELGQPRKEGFKQLADKYQIQGEQAEDYMKKYWS
jgi:hypothetical protein